MITGFALAPTWWILAPEHSLAAALTVTAAHMISGLLFSCDLDIDSLEYQRWGPLRFIWWPYKEAVPHRSWISHGLIIGPLLRLAYFTFFLYGLLWLGLHATDNAALWRDLARSFTSTLQNHTRQTYAFLIGFVLGGAAHSIPDWITTGTKRTWHQWTRL